MNLQGVEVLHFNLQPNNEIVALVELSGEGTYQYDIFGALVYQRDGKLKVSGVILFGEDKLELCICDFVDGFTGYAVKDDDSKDDNSDGDNSDKDDPLDRIFGPKRDHADVWLN